MINRKTFSPTGYRTVEHNGVIYISGATAPDRSQDMKGQTAQVLERLTGFLETAGSDRSKVLLATIFVTDMSAKAGMDEAWKEYFGDDQLPARATIGVADLGKDCLIEIQFTAAL